MNNPIISVENLSKRYILGHQRSGDGLRHAVEGVVWLSGLVLLVHRARAWLTRPSVTRRLAQITGLVFVGFGVRLALEQAPG